MQKKLFFGFLYLLAFSLHADDGKDKILGFHDNAKGSPLVELIDSAKQSLDVEIYEMSDTHVLDGIRRALARNVRVQVVQEPSPVGGSCKLFAQIDAKDDKGCTDQKNLVLEVNSQNGSYVPFSKTLCGVDKSSCLQHGKIVIVDNRRALVSTGNFNETNLCDLDQNPKVCDRDYSYVTDDKAVVSTMKAIFENDLKGERYDLTQLMSADASAKLTVSPVSLSAILAFIASARKSIQIENQYLHEPQINEALIEAAKHAKIDITVSSFCSFARPSEREQTTVGNVYGAFADAGISSRLMTNKVLVNDKPGYLHAKAIIVDGTRAWIGSMNGSNESATMNREYGLFFDDPESVKQLSEIMRADHQDPGTETWEESLKCVKDR